MEWHVSQHFSWLDTHVSLIRKRTSDQCHLIHGILDEHKNDNVMWLRKPRAEIRINYLEMPLTLFLIYWHSQTQSMHPTFKGQDYHGNKHSHKLNHKWQTLQLSSWSVDNGAHKMHTICTTRNSVHSSTKILWILWIFSTVLLSATVAVFVSIHF